MKTRFVNDSLMFRCAIGTVGYPLHSGDPKILWSASRRLGVLVGDDRAVRRRIDRDRLLNESVEEFAATA